MNCSGLNENIGSQASERDSWEDTSDPHLIIANAVEDIFDQYAVDEQGYSLRTAPESPVPIQDANLAQSTGSPEPFLSRLQDVLHSRGPYAGEGGSHLDISAFNSQGSADLGSQEEALDNLRRSLEPRPLRIPSRPLQGPDQTFSNDENEASSDEQSSSDQQSSSEELYGPHENPFKYDNASYRRVLDAFKERDVNQALRRLAHTSQSEASLASPAGSPIKKVGGSNALATNQQQFRDAAGQAFYEGTGPYLSDPDIQQPICLADGQPHEVKVVIQRASDERFGEAGQQERGSGSYGQHSNARRNADRVLPRDVTSESGWVTEATSDVGSSEDVGSNTQFPLFDFKAAGSSIADYSDNEVADTGSHNGPFASHEPILRHPPGEDQGGSYGLHNLKDTNKQALLPRTPVRDGTGFPQNSMRLFSPKSKDASTTPRRPNAIRQLPNPFRQGSYRRADSNDNFQFKRSNDPSRYEFRDSASEYGQALHSNHATRGSITCPPSPTGSDWGRERDDDVTIGLTISNVNSARKPQTVHVPDDVDHDSKFVRATLDSTYTSRQSRDVTVDRQFVRDSPSSFDYGRTPTRSFSVHNDFELLPLDEARHKLKRQRESGETDETEPASLRFQRVRSRASSQAFSTSNSPQAPSLARTRQGQRKTPPTVTPLRLFPKPGSQGTSPPRTFYISMLTLLRYSYPPLGDPTG